MEHIGFVVEQFPNHGVIRRARAKVQIGFDKDGFILVFSALRRGMGKNSRLAEEVERILLASGAKVYGKPISTNLVYQVRELPNPAWLENLNLPLERIIHTSHAGSDGFTKVYPCGSFEAGAQSIRFWTGSAIDSETKSLIHYISLGADAICLGVSPVDSLLNSLDLALIGKGAKRIDVQRELDK